MRDFLFHVRVNEFVETHHVIAESKHKAFYLLYSDHNLNDVDNIEVEEVYRFEPVIGGIYKMRAIEGVKKSLQGARVKLTDIDRGSGTCIVQLLENKRRFNAGDHMTSFLSNLEEINE